MLELTLRLIFSLAVVVGLLLVLTKLGAKRFRGGPDALVQVVQRQALSRTAAVSVVTVGSRVLVLGTTEQQVSVLAELDPEELVGLEPVAELDPADDTVASYDPSGLVASTAAEDSVTPDAVVTPVRSGNGAVRRPRTAPEGGALTGSVFSADTWRRTLAALQGADARGAEPRS